MRNDIFSNFSWAIAPVPYYLTEHPIAHSTPFAKLFTLLQSVFDTKRKILLSFFLRKNHTEIKREVLKKFLNDVKMASL